MSLLNVIDEPVICPNCGRAYDAGFEIGVGRNVRARLRIGDRIPSDLPSEPGKQWTTEGLGKCLWCGSWITADIQLQGSTIKGIVRVAIG